MPGGLSRPWPYTCLRSGSGSVGLLLTVWLAVSQAQVTTMIRPDGSLGTQVTQQVIQQGSVFSITGGRRPGNGPNLFHSFDRFTLGRNDTASFAGPSGITNILTRVTGGERSQIDGTLRSTANLFLLNPSGVVFGPTARLDVQGAFHVSTADYLRLADGARFYADLGATSTLSMAVPEAFGFLGPAPKSIVFEGSTLRTPEGGTLSVVGGDIEVRGGLLQVPGGRLQLVSAASVGEVSLEDARSDIGRLGQRGTIHLSQEAGLIASSDDGGGSILIRGGRLIMERGTGIAASTRGPKDGRGIDIAVEHLSLKDGAVIRSNTSGTGRAGDVTVTATETITITGRDQAIGRSTIESVTSGRGAAGHVTITAPSIALAGGEIKASSLGAGKAGGISIEVGHLSLIEDAQIVSRTGSAPGGHVTITASEAITIRGRPDGRQPTGIISRTAGSGATGHVRIRAPQVTIDGGGIFTGPERLEDGQLGDGQVGGIHLEVGHLTLTRDAKIASETVGTMPGGSVNITASKAITITRSSIGSMTAGRGTAGHVTITAPSIDLTGGQIYETVSKDGTGDAGQLRITAGRLTMIGGSIDTSSSGDGKAAELSIEVGHLSLTGDALLGGSTFGAPGGDIAVTASEAITMTGGSTIGNTTGGGAATGRIDIRAPQVTMDGGVILTGAIGDGRAGNVRIDVERLTLTGGASIASNASGAGPGGHVTIIARDTIAVSGHNQNGAKSGIASLTQGGGRPGSVTVMAPSLTLDGGLIGTSPLSRANAGEINITVDRLALKGDALIFGALIGPGRGGDVTVTAKETVTISGDPQADLQSRITTTTLGMGDAGNITVKAPRLVMEHGGAITADTGGNGHAGTIVVQVGQASLTGGAQISSSSFGSDGQGHPGTGAGGTVMLTATDTVAIAGPNSGLSTRTAGSGSGGNMHLQARQILMADGATLSAESDNAGAGGNITLTTPTLMLTGGSVTTATKDAGRAGDITLNVDSLVAQAGTVTSSSRTAMVTAKAGTVTIQGVGGLGTRATRLTLTGNSRIATEATVADGGDIQVRAQGIVRLRDSQITTAVGNGQGRGGNILIDPQFVILERSQILAEAFGGPGGNIRLVAQGFVPDAASRVSASSTLSVPGTVTIDAATTPNSLVAPLPQAFAPATSLLATRCAERLWEGRVSTFVVQGPEGVPASPGGLLPSLLDTALDSPTQADGTPEQTQAHEPIRLAPRAAQPRLQLSTRLDPSFAPLAWHLPCPAW